MPGRRGPNTDTRDSDDFTMNPYSDFDRVRGSVEELAFKKQLPLRQQTDKPVLKYDTTLTKPVQLFSQPDVAAQRHEGRPPPSQASHTVATSASSGSAKGHTSSLVTQNHRKSRGTSLRRLQTSPSNGVDNPYSRPLSAKEVSEDVQRSRRMVANGLGAPSGLMVHSPSIPSLHSQNLESTLNAAALQLNSFMRPQSTVHLETAANGSGTTHQKKTYRVAMAAGDSVSVGGKMEAKQKDLMTPKKQTVPHAVASAKSVVPHASETPPRAKNGLVNSTGAYDSLSSKRTVVRNPNYTPNKPYSEVSEPCVKEAVSNAPTNITVPASVPVSEPSTFSMTSDAKWHPAVASSNLTSKPPLSHPAGSKKGPPKMPGSRVLPSSGVISSMAGVEESCPPLHNLTASSLLSTNLGILRKMPVTHTLTGTLYYKKCIKEVDNPSESTPAINEQRPVGDGAPAKAVRGAPEEKIVKQKGEKAALLEDAPEEDEEDDLSTPSGERLPGDGEASCEELNDVDCPVEADYEDDDGLDDLYNDCGEDDGESDDYTVSSEVSQSSCTIRLKSAVSCPSTAQSARSRVAAAGEERSQSFMRPVTASGEAIIQPALRTSLFAAIPPTINFILEGEKVELLPWALRKFLKWRMSPITPNIVKHALARIGFRITKKNHDWLGCFGKHMKAQGFKNIREYQKLNHFPGSFQLGRKDRLWRNLSRMQLSFGKKEFGFFPQTFVLPQDLKLLKRAWEDGASRQKWIIKPPAAARGIGIKVIHKWNQIPRRRPVVVQKYLSHPLLINDSKFDMRIYVYVTSYDPLRAYVFEDGLARFASCKYSSSMKNLSNKFMHLTNYSINKHNADYKSNADDSVCQGHKWSLKALWTYLKKQGVNTAAVWDSIKDLAVKTLISSEASINSMVKAHVRSRYMVHELFGFDVLLDENYHPWILEVNISPSLHSNSQLDINIKGQMIRDMMNLAGFRLPDKNDIHHATHQTGSVADLSAHIPSSDYCMDKRLFTNQLAPDERAKHAYYCHRHQDEQALQTVLDVLTPDDVRILTESIDEDSRKGGFIRVFPTPTTHKYLRFFEAPRYYNLLLDQWVQRYNRMEQRGISLLQSLCEEGVHLESPNEGHRYQWYPPNSPPVVSARDKCQSTTQVVKGKDGVHSMLKSSQVHSRLPRVRAGASSSSPMGSSSVTRVSSLSSVTSPPQGSSPVTSWPQPSRTAAVPDPDR